MGRWQEEACPGFISETTRCKKFTLSSDIDLNMMCDFAIVTLTFKILSGYISETIRCRKFILGRTLVRACRCASS